MSADLYYGYDHLLRQPCVLLNQELAYDPGIDLAATDSWLTDYFGIDRARLFEPNLLNGDSPRQQVLAQVSRALAIYGEILSVSGVPCSEPGKVVRIAPVEGRDGVFAVTIAIAVVDNLHFRLLANVLRDAFVVVLQDMRVEPTRDAAEELMKRLKDVVIEPLVKAIPFKLGGGSILEMVHNAGIPYRHIGAGIFRIGWGARAKLLQRASSNNDSAIGARLCGYKPLTVEALRAAGFPVPRHVLAGSAEEAVSAAQRLGWPVVVKPADRDRSEGVTTDLADPAALVAAYEEARRFSDNVLIEAQVPGRCHRVLVANGRVIYVVDRIPKGVWGNGRDSVAELVAQANADRMRRPTWRRLKEFPLDDLADEVLADQGLSRGSIPADGQRANLRRITSDQWGGDVANLTATIHPDNVRLCIEATAALGMAIVGVDLMSTDITRPWHETGGAIIEMNFGPQFLAFAREEDAATVVNGLIEGDGRIPVHLVIGGGDTLATARSLRGRLARESGGCHLVTATTVLDGDGDPLPMAATSLFDRAIALVQRSAVHQLVIAGTPEELLPRGFPVDRFESVTVVDPDPDKAARLARQLEARIAMGQCQIAALAVTVN